MIKISELAKKVQEIGEANPTVRYDLIYQEHYPNEVAMCAYQLNGSPACLVGRALHELGVDIETLVEFDGGEDPIFSEEIKQVVKDNPDLFRIDDPEALEFLEEVQHNQDSGLPWGDAVR